MAIEEMEKPAARERQGARTDLGLPGPGTGKFQESREIAAEAVGMSEPTIRATLDANRIFFPVSCRLSAPSGNNPYVKRKITSILASLTLAIGALSVGPVSAASAEELSSFDQALTDAVTLAQSQEGIPGDITSESESEYDPQVDTVEFSLTNVTAAAYTSVKCSAKINNAHYSNGAGGAIFKAVVTCSGTGATSVKVQVGSVLSFAPSSAANKVPTSTYKTRAESKYTQPVPVNSGSKTFYVPKTGNGGTGKGFWIRTSVWQITSPGLGTIGSKTKTNWCDLKKGSICS